MEMMALRNGLLESSRILLYRIIAEGDSFCPVCWVSGCCLVSSRLADIMEVRTLLYLSIRLQTRQWIFWANKESRVRQRVWPMICICHSDSLDMHFSLRQAMICMFHSDRLVSLFLVSIVYFAPAVSGGSPLFFVWIESPSVLTRYALLYCIALEFIMFGYQSKRKEREEILNA